MIDINSKKHWLQQQAEINPNKIAVEYSGEKFTFAGLFNVVARTAYSLEEKKIKKNIHVAILSNNSIEFFIVVNALWLLGAVPVPLNTRLKEKEISKLIKHSGCKVFININANVDMEKVECKRKINFPSLQTLTSKQIANPEEFGKNNTALLMYSSGSTGNPKCVELTFENLYSATVAFNAYINCVSKDIWLASLPFYHIGGFSIITRALINGNKVVIPKSFSVKDLLKSFNETKPSYFSVVPTVMQRIFDSKIKPWANLKTVFIGGGPVPEKLIDFGIEKKWPITKVYGSTETSAMVTAIGINELKDKPFSVGKPLHNVSIEIINENKNIVQNREIGEVVIESESVAKQYLNYNGNSKIVDKKFYSNDLGYIDEEGFLFIKGRKDDMIISGGENINLTEIEEYIKTIDIVKDCTTLKIEDITWGESYILIVSVSNNKNSFKEIIANKLKGNFAKYKHPKDIFVIDKIPRNELGKVMKGKIKELLA